MNVAAADREGLPPSPEVPTVAPRPQGVHSRFRITASQLAFVVPALGTFVLLCFRNRYVFSVAIREDGDFAANSILIQRAAHFHQLVGEYSRVGFNHPGPAYLYIEAAGQTIFYTLLHLVPSAYDGELLATFALNAVIVGLIVWIFFRQGRSGLASGAAGAIIIAYTGFHLSFSSAWFPHLFFGSFLLFMVAGASIASRDLSDLPVFVFAGGLLANGHVAFLEFVAVWTVVVAVVWFRRNRSTLGAAVTAHRRAVTISAVLLGLFLLPLVLNVALHFPGEWRKYAAYVKHNGSNTHSLQAAFKYLSSFWAHRRRSGALMVLAGAVAVGLTRFEPEGDRRRFFGWLLGAAAVMSVLFFAYAVRGVDDLSAGYIGVFYMAVPVVVLMVAAAATVSAVGRLGQRGLAGPPAPAYADRSRSWRDTVGVGVGLVLIVALIGAGATGRIVTNPYRGDGDLTAAIASVKNAPQRAGRPVAISFPNDSWPVVVGFMINARRVGLVTCVTDAFWTFMVTTDYVCRPGVGAGSWQVRFDPVTGSPAAGRVPIWSDSQEAITAAA